MLYVGMKGDMRGDTTEEMRVCMVSAVVADRIVTQVAKGPRWWLYRERWKETGESY